MLNVLTIHAHNIESLTLTETQALANGNHQYWTRDLVITRDNGQKQKIELYSCTSAEALEVINV